MTGGANEFEILVVAGGNGCGYFEGKITAGGEVIEDKVMLHEGEALVVVGDGGYDADPGKDGVGQPSSFAGRAASAGKTTEPVGSTITGTEEFYGGNGNRTIDAKEEEGQLDEQGRAPKENRYRCSSTPLVKTLCVRDLKTEWREITQLHRKLHCLTRGGKRRCLGKRNFPHTTTHPLSS